MKESSPTHHNIDAHAITRIPRMRFIIANVLRFFCCLKNAGCGAEPGVGAAFCMFGTMYSVIVNPAAIIAMIKS